MITDSDSKFGALNSIAAIGINVNGAPKSFCGFPNALVVVSIAENFADVYEASRLVVPLTKLAIDFRGLVVISSRLLSFIRIDRLSKNAASLLECGRQSLLVATT